MLGFEKSFNEFKENLFDIIEKSTSLGFDEYRILNTDPSAMPNIYRCEREVEIIFRLIEKKCIKKSISIKTDGVFPDGTPRYIVIYEKIKELWSNDEKSQYCRL